MGDCSVGFLCSIWMSGVVAYVGRRKVCINIGYMKN